jgi:phosphinothricin acetyltransferase
VIRLAAQADARSIVKIFGPSVENTATSFATKFPTEAEIVRKIEETKSRLPWLVHEEAAAVLGYAYASPHRTLGAYRWSVETSIYVDPSAQRRGVARGLYATLIAILKAQGYFNAYAGITLPNEASVTLHEAMGFRRFCVFESIGYKLGRWCDVGWWRLPLQDRYCDDPAEPIPFGDLLADDPDLIGRFVGAQGRVHG